MVMDIVCCCTVQMSYPEFIIGVLKLPTAMSHVSLQLQYYRERLSRCARSTFSIENAFLKMKISSLYIGKFCWYANFNSIRKFHTVCYFQHIFSCGNDKSYSVYYLESIHFIFIVSFNFCVINQNILFFLESIFRIVKASWKHSFMRSVAIVYYITCHVFIITQQSVDIQMQNVLTLLEKRFKPMKTMKPAKMVAMQLTMRWHFRQRQYSNKHQF